MRFPRLIAPVAALMLAVPVCPVLAQTVGQTIEVKGWHVRLDKSPDGSFTCAAMWAFEDKSSVGFAADTSGNTFLIVSEPDAGLVKNKQYVVSYHADSAPPKAATGIATSPQMLVITISDPDADFAVFGKSGQITVDVDGDSYDEPLEAARPAIQALGKCIAGAPAGK